MKAGLRQNTTTRTNMCTYLGPYPEASTEHWASGSWILREVWRATDNSSHGNSPKEGRGDSPPTAASAQLPAASVAEASGTQQCTELHETPFRALLQAGGGASSGGLTLTPR